MTTDVTSSITAVGGPAIDSSGATGGTLAFGTVSSSNSTSTGIALGGKAAFSATGGSITGAATVGFDVNGGDASIAYPGAITPAANGTAARIQSRTASTVSLSGNLTTTGTGIGVNVSGNTGGTITFSGASKSLASASANAVSLAANTGATVQFTVVAAHGHVDLRRCVSAQLVAAPSRSAAPGTRSAPELAPRCTSMA